MGTKHMPRTLKALVGVQGDALIAMGQMLEQRSLLILARPLSMARANGAERYAGSESTRVAILDRWYTFRRVAVTHQQLLVVRSVAAGNSDMATGPN
jgi:hypothetical protein